jgi:EmrB/QacA subfamily drug resistance transporter
VEPGKELRPWLVLLASCLAAFLVAMDATIVNLALPTIQREFRVTLVEGSWVLNAYTLTFAALVVVGGKMCDLYGRKRVLLIGSTIFATGSLLAALSPNVYMLQSARVIQGMGSAMMMPGSLSVLAVAFLRKDLGLAIGVWGGIGALGLAMGPVVSGAFVSAFTWRAIFFLSLGIVLFSMLITYLMVRDSRDLTIDRRIDFLGVGLSASAVFLLTLGIIGGNIYGWTSATTLGLFSAALFMLALFVFAQVLVPFHIIDPSFFRNRAFAVASAVRFAAGFAFIPVILMSTIFMQTFLHKSPLEAGLLFLPAGVTVVIATPFWGKVADRVGPRIPMLLGMSLAGLAAFLWLRFDADSSYSTLLPSLMLASFGGSAAFVTTTAVVLNSLGENKAGVASGMVNMMQNVSAVLGVALVSAVFLNSLRSGLAKLAPGVDYQRVQAFGPSDALQAEVFANALADAALVVMVVLILGAIIALFLPKTASRPRRT